MARRSATSNKMLGIALIVIGTGLLYWGYQHAGSISSQLSQTLTGSHTDKVMMLYIGGAVSLALGMFLSIKK